MQLTDVTLGTADVTHGSGPTEASQSCWLIGPQGDRVALPAGLFETLVEAIERLEEGHTVTIRKDSHRIAILDRERELSPRQAAEMLNVSRPHLVKLLNAGELPSRMVGTHHRIRFDDVVVYRERVNASRNAAMRAIFDDLDDDEY